MQFGRSKVRKKDEWQQVVLKMIVADTRVFLGHVTRKLLIKIANQKQIRMI